MFTYSLRHLDTLEYFILIFMYLITFLSEVLPSGINLFNVNHFTRFYTV